MINNKKHTLVNMKDREYIWYNSYGQALNVDKYHFLLFKCIYPYEILDKYELVARSLEFVNEKK